METIFTHLPIKAVIYSIGKTIFWLHVAAALLALSFIFWAALVSAIRRFLL